MTDSVLVTTGEAAAMLSVCDRTIQLWVVSGRLQGAIRRGGRYLVPQESVLAMLQPVGARSGQADDSDAGSSEDDAARTEQEASSEPADHRDTSRRGQGEMQLPERVTGPFTFGSVAPRGAEAPSHMEGTEQ